MKHLSTIVLFALSIGSSLSYACEMDTSRNLNDGCKTFSVNFSVVQKQLDTLTLKNLNEIGAKIETLVMQFGAVDSCALYVDQPNKYRTFMDTQALASGIQKVRNGATVNFSKEEGKSLTPRELFLLARLVDSKFDVGSALTCRY